MPVNKRFTDAPGEYSREEQQRFRRELEQMVVILSAVIEGISGGTDAQASVHSRTKNFIFDDIGQETIT